MHDAETEALRAAVEVLHNCAAFPREAEVVTVSIGSFTCQRVVTTFHLTGHPSASRCYAWTDPAPERGRVHRVILHGMLTNTAEAAVRSFLVLQPHDSSG